MNSDPIRVTSCRDPLSKNIRNVINLFLDPKMRSTAEVSSIEVMFSAHGDSVWSKVKNPNDRSLKTLQIFVFTISLKLRGAEYLVTRLAQFYRLSVITTIFICRGPLQTLESVTN